MESIHWVLASSSPRRIELLRGIGINPEIRAPQVDERVLKGETPKEMVKRLSALKAHVVGELLDAKSPTLIIAADTTVVDGSGEILGKPTSEKEGLKMLKRLEGRTHTVLTGFTVLAKGSGGTWARAVTKVVRTKVTFRSLTPPEARAYFQCGESLDKAGGYAAQGFGMALIKSVNGSYSNVVGLPMERLVSVLGREFGVPLFSWVKR